MCYNFPYSSEHQKHRSCIKTSVYFANMTERFAKLINFLFAISRSNDKQTIRNVYVFIYFWQAKSDVHNFIKSLNTGYWFPLASLLLDDRIGSKGTNYRVKELYALYVGHGQWRVQVSHYGKLGIAHKTSRPKKS